MTRRWTWFANLAGGALVGLLGMASPGCGGAQEPVAPAATEGPVPADARDLLAYVRQHGFPPPDHLGGRVFQNYEGKLPRFDPKGKRVLYREWDVKPKAIGGAGGRQHLVTGSDGRAWYTADAGQTFTEVK